MDFAKTIPSYFLWKILHYWNHAWGVPQGLNLGPLLLLIYVNDMFAVVKHKLLLYADECNICIIEFGFPISGEKKQTFIYRITAEVTHFCWRINPTFKIKKNVEMQTGKVTYVPTDPVDPYADIPSTITGRTKVFV